MNVKETAPTLYAYLHRFRANPLFSEHIMPQEPQNKHLIKQNAKPLGEKQQLDVDVLE